MTALVDPSELPTMLTSMIHHTPSIDSTDTVLSSPEVQSMLSTMISFVKKYPDGWVPPLHPNDPLLLSGKPIPPVSVRLDQGVKTAQDLLPGASTAIQEQAQAAMKSGWKVLNGNNIIEGGSPAMPGFAPTRTLLPYHMESSPDTPAKFGARIMYSNTLLPLFNRLPYVAIWYALLEFFFIRNNLDVYKEEIEDDPEGVTAETLSVVGVRVGIFFILAMLTVIFT